MGCEIKKWVYPAQSNDNSLSSVHEASLFL